MFSESCRFHRTAIETLFLLVWFLPARRVTRSPSRVSVKLHSLRTRCQNWTAQSLREVRHVRELAFAALPLLFALHQLIEAVVWARFDGLSVSGPLWHAAVLAYVSYAMVVLPTLFPLSVLLLEPRGDRLRVAPFVVLGLAMSVVFAVEVFSAPVTVVAHPHALEYATGLRHGDLLSVGYIVAVIGPALFSGYRSVVAFGLVNLVGLVVVAAQSGVGCGRIWIDRRGSRRVGKKAVGLEAPDHPALRVADARMLQRAEEEDVFALEISRRDLAPVRPAPDSATAVKPRAVSRSRTPS